MIINISDANVIYDTRWDDHIKGSDNDQHIYLTHGNDIIDGAGGSDTVHIDELSTDFDLTRYTNSLSIQNKTNSSEEIITVNTEFIQFSDTLIDVSSLEEASVLDLSNIVQHDTFEKIGGGNTNGFITQMESMFLNKILLLTMMVIGIVLI